jgi:hypothetical protein
MQELSGDHRSTAALLRSQVFFFWRGKQFILRKTTYLQLPMCWVAVDELSAPNSLCQQAEPTGINTGRSPDHRRSGPPFSTPFFRLPVAYGMLTSTCQRVNASTLLLLYYWFTGIPSYYTTCQLALYSRILLASRQIIEQLRLPVGSLRLTRSQCHLSPRYMRH